MTYTSSKPTKEKRRLYEFMERNKKQGSVGEEKFEKYVDKKGMNLKHIKSTPKTGPRSMTKIVNNRGAQIGTISVNKKKVDWWNIN